MKKILIFILSLVIICSLFVGCTDDEVIVIGDSSSESESNVNATDTDTDTDTDTEIDVEVGDDGGDENNWTANY